MNIKVLGLCAGRHELPADVEGYIFDKIEDVTDLKAINAQVHLSLKNIPNNTLLRVYVTGLSVALVAVINYCTRNLIPLELMHFNYTTGEYYCQDTNTDMWYTYLHEGDYV